MKVPIKVLYVNHTGQISGAERSLLELVKGVSPQVTPLVACPDGPLVDALAAGRIARVRIPGTEGSLRLHPRHTPEALWSIAQGAAAVRSAAAHHRVSLVHANSIRAGLFTALGWVAGGPPTIVHLRDRLPHSPLSTLTLRTIGRSDLLIANSEYTARSLDEAGVTRRRRVIGNPVDLSRFDPGQVDRAASRAALGLADSDVVCSVVAQITPWKGQEDAIRAVALVRERHPSLRLLLVGTAKFVSKATRYDNRAYLEGLHRLVAELGLTESVRFLGEREDVPAVLRATDALLVPSWEEPFGRSVIEAMAMRVPVIATTIGGPAEVITNEADGLLAAPRRPQEWARALTMLLESPGLQTRLATNGARRARAFGVQAHGQELCRLYRELLGDHAVSADVAAAGSSVAV
jgi:glycosyltransferase involved in cell wall biosynthesis